MAKLLVNNNPKPGEPDVEFYCPGCKCDHGVWVTSKNGNNSIWTWNGSVDRPTFSPSILIKYLYRRGMPDEKMRICHTFVNDGKIQYLNDCTHHLAGQTIDLPEVEAS